MCTLIVFHRCFADAELVIAANRDESLDRPAEPPALRAWHGRTVLAPRDARAGGTWLGTNDAGLFAALTNRPNPHPDAARRSRGLLVSDALAAASAAEAAARLGELAARTYNPFNLVVCDSRDAFVVVYEEKPDVRRLDAGAHVIGNGDPDSRRLPKVARLLESTCIHAGAYGTRSSTLMRRGSQPGQDVFHFAGGPPCRHAYQDFTPLLAQLDRPGMRAGAAERTHA
jgi:uncharacterized protein with NRDE domain